MANGGHHETKPKPDKKQSESADAKKQPSSTKQNKKK